MAKGATREDLSDPRQESFSTFPTCPVRSPDATLSEGKRDGSQGDCPFTLYSSFFRDGSYLHDISQISAETFPPSRTVPDGGTVG